MVDLPVVLMRGGTSKGVFLRMTDLPADPVARDDLLLRLMGSPDPMQLNGLGGTHSSTSKAMFVGPAREPGAEVEYLFAQVAVEQAVVDYNGNCGNLTAAVAHYAVEEGLVTAVEPTTVVLLRNLNTNVIVRATVEVAGGRVLWQGDTAIDGVPGTGAALRTDYLEPGGSVTGTLFPSGGPRAQWSGIDVSIVDVATPHVFVRASDLALQGDEPTTELNNRSDLLAHLADLRAWAGKTIGIDSLAVPRLVVLSPGRHVKVFATSMGKVHHATPITTALCTAAAARLRGTVVYDIAQPDDGPIVRIEHPKGAVEATIEIHEGRVIAAGVLRTARRLLTGTAHV